MEKKGKHCSLLMKSTDSLFSIEISLVRLHRKNEGNEWSTQIIP